MVIGPRLFCADDILPAICIDRLAEHSDGADVYAANGRRDLRGDGNVEIVENGDVANGQVDQAVLDLVGGAAPGRAPIPPVNSSDPPITAPAAVFLMMFCIFCSFQSGSSGPIPRRGD